MNKEDAKNRLISAALGVAKAERGGLDQSDSVAELELAGEIFDEAVLEYARALTDGREANLEEG